MQWVTKPRELNVFQQSHVRSEYFPKKGGGRPTACVGQAVRFPGFASEVRTFVGDAVSAAGVGAGGGRRGHTALDPDDD